MFCGPEYFGWHGFFGLPFFGLLIVGLLVWTLVVTARRKRPVAAGLATCPGCSRTIDPLWRYCPVCGKGTGTDGAQT